MYVDSWHPTLHNFYSRAIEKFPNNQYHMHSQHVHNLLPKNSCLNVKVHKLSKCMFHSIIEHVGMKFEKLQQQ
jgi:hypothetical protein